MPGRSSFTSLRAAEGLRRRGRIVFERPNLIRFLDCAAIVQERQIKLDVQRDGEYWEMVARQRGAGAFDKLGFEIRRTAEKPEMVGGPEGFSHLVFIPAIIGGHEDGQNAPNKLRGPGIAGHSAKRRAI